MKNIAKVLLGLAALFSIQLVTGGCDGPGYYGDRGYYGGRGWYHDGGWMDGGPGIGVGVDVHPGGGYYRR